MLKPTLDLNSNFSGWTLGKIEKQKLAKAESSSIVRSRYVDEQQKDDYKSVNVIVA